jgi:hypothetical protein
MVALVIAPEGVRSETYSEAYVRSAQARAVLDRPSDHCDGRRGSFPSHLLDLAPDDAFHTAYNGDAYPSLHHPYVCT